MLFTAFSILALALSSALAAPFSNLTNICGTTISDDEIAVAEAHFAANKVSFKARAESAANIQVYWHVIQSGANLTQGNIPDSQIDDSISALNKYYNGSGLTFTLARTDRTTNEDWFDHATLGTSLQADMKKALRQGDVTALNVYTVGFTFIAQAGLLGYAPFPWKYAENPMDDGVVILYSTVPGGSRVNYNEGKSLAHEVGHWLGLYHTFQGGCLGDGDHVDDTAPEAIQSDGCTVGRDTCPGGDVDPINNYMDYSITSCVTQFTAGQFERIRGQIAIYRGIQA
ncbi:hypothetical protein FRC08_011897 [Ceratobasidium sp. 394]|nr:hypothetical protein FRC08_011897 [Ceratobasidium sp. 394]